MGRRFQIIPRLAGPISLIALALVGCGGSSGSSVPLAGTPSGGSIPWLLPARPIPGLHQRVLGSGPGGVVVLWSAGSSPPRKVVIFFHPWQPLPPFTQSEWLRHLARAGNTIVYPAYQSRSTRSQDFLRYASTGIGLAFRALHHLDRRSVVAIGRTTGGALAFDYAARAAADDLPVPRAVLAVFPGRRPPSGEIAPADLAQIPAGTLLEVIAGPGDPLPDARAEARALLRASTEVPARDRRLLEPRFPADLPRVAPAVGRAAERRAFWRPADELIAQVGAG